MFTTMKFSCWLLSITVIISVFLSQSVALGKSYPPQVRSTALSLSDSINNFAYSLHKALPSSDNIVFSPWSLSFALAMISLGADGKTLSEMRDAMFLSKITPDNVNYGFKQLREHLTNYDSKYEMNMFSTILVQEKHNISPVYKLNLQRFFDSDIHDVDFAELAPLVTAWINVWTSLKTGGKITDILPTTPNQNTLMLLLTSNYFKGVWEEAFNLNHTLSSYFYNSDQKQTTVDMMYATRNFSTYSGTKLGVHAVDIPMKGDVNFLFVMPMQHEEFDKLEKNLSAEFFQEIFSNMGEIPLEVGIPKFEASSRLNLQDALESIGMTSLFSPKGADLSRISTSGGLFVEEVIHKATMEVNEEGATATSITVISVISRIKVYRLHFDRPFLFFVRDTKSGTVLFMGRVSDL